MKKKGKPESVSTQRGKPAPSLERQYGVKVEVLTLTIDELAPLIGKSVSSIRSDMSRHPERLPKWWKCPGGAKRALWLVSTVEEFIVEQAARCGAGVKVEE